MRFYKVGGCVRDEILGRKSNDIDYTVILQDAEKKFLEANPELTPFEVMEHELLHQGFKIFQSRPEYFTVRAMFPKTSDGPTGVADFVLARKERGYADNRRPDSVELGSLRDDLARRDFTINAIAQDEAGGIHDPFNGAGDLSRRVIRAVGDAHQRLREDALRILRAVRFAVVLDFTITPGTAEAVRNLSDTLRTLPEERIEQELYKMFAINTTGSIRILEEYGLTDIVFSRNLWLTPTLKRKK